jgi:glycerate kinase
MPARDPFKLPYTRGLPRLENLKTALSKNAKQFTVTQGGSSRRDAGARVAAKVAQVRQKKRESKNEDE